jgi:dTDP-L-rhamnose 4-epimerase
MDLRQVTPTSQPAGRRVLITGGAGFIGSRLALLLVDRGCRVRVLDSLAPQIHGPDPLASPLFRSIEGKVEFVRGSVTSREDLTRALNGIDVVVHLAAETGTGQSMYAIQHYADVNIAGTALLLDLVANHPFPVKRIVVASSRAVYGEGKYECSRDGTVYPGSRVAEDMARGDFEIHCPACGAVARMVPTDESTPVAPVSVYGVTKLTQEQLVLTVARALGISAVAFRYQNVYGPGQSLTNPYTGILSIFSTRIRNGGAINIFEDGTESRDFVYIDDVAGVTADAAMRTDSFVGALNVGSGVATDVISVAMLLQQLLGTEVSSSVSGQFRVGDIRHNVADLTRVRAVFGFEPSVAIEEGLRRFVAWVQGESRQPDRYEESLEEMRAKGLFK